MRVNKVAILLILFLVVVASVSSVYAELQTAATKDLWVSVLADSPKYKELAGPELLLVGRVAMWGGYPVGHPELNKWSYNIQVSTPWQPVADVRECQAAFDRIRGKRTPKEFNHTKVLLKAKLNRNRSSGKYPIVVVGSMREIRPDEKQWDMPWLANLPLLPPERVIFSTKAVAACQATTAADSMLGFSGVQHASQNFKVLKVFHGDLKPGQDLKLGYSYLVINDKGRDVAKGERLIWVMTGDKEHFNGHAAVPDTPYHRKEALALAARVKSAPPQIRRDLHDLSLSKAKVATRHEAEVPDLFVESATGSKKWEFRKEAKLIYNGPDGEIYFATDKKCYYVRRYTYTATGIRVPSHYFGPFKSDPSLLPSKKEINEIKDQAGVGN